MKTCSRCGHDKIKEDFYHYNSGSCKSCCSDAINRKKQRRRYWLGKYKVEKGCHVCGFNQSIHALDWHHVNMEEKEAHITDLHSGKLTKLFHELKKCVVLCANCHRMVHAHEIYL
jgi:hypothetical protein